MDILSACLHKVPVYMDKATLWTWGVFTPERSFNELSASKCLMRCVYFVALALFTAVTLGTFHLATYCYLAYRIKSTDITNTPLHNPNVLRTAMFLHAKLCTQFAQRFHTPPLPQSEQLLITDILQPKEIASNTLLRLSRCFLDKQDTRSYFEKYRSFVQDYELRCGRQDPPSEDTLQEFVATLLTRLVSQNDADDPHPLFRKDNDGYHLSDNASQKELCEAIGVLLGAWLSDHQLVQYPLGPIFSLNFYLDFLSLRQNPKQLAARPLQEVAEAFKQIYQVDKGGIEALLCGEPHLSARLLATLLQGTVYEPESGVHLLQAAAETPNITRELMARCDSLKIAFETDVTTIRPFLLTLHEVEITPPPGSNGDQERYGNRVDLIHAIQKHPIDLLPAQEYI